MNAAFKSLRIQAETDRHEMLKEQHQEALQSSKQEQESLLESAKCRTAQ